MFKSDGNVIHFAAPKGKISEAIQAQREILGAVTANM